MSLPAEEKASLVRAARALALRTFGESPAGACAVLALCASRLAWERHRLLLAVQVGTLQWRIVPEADDDGVSPTCFSYVWESDAPRTLEALEDGRLPECHVWLGDVERQELVDVSTGGLLEQQELQQPKLRWRTAMPPDFLWCPGRDVPADANYMPSREATVLVVERVLKRAARELGGDVPCVGQLGRRRVS